MAPKPSFRETNIKDFMKKYCFKLTFFNNILKFRHLVHNKKILTCNSIQNSLKSAKMLRLGSARKDWGWKLTLIFERCPSASTPKMILRVLFEPQIGYFR